MRYKGATTEDDPGIGGGVGGEQGRDRLDLYLRKGVKFHDGNAFDAAAVVWNFDRSESSASTRSTRIGPKAGQTFEYYEAQFGGFDEKSLITKVEAVDPAAE